MQRLLPVLLACAVLNADDIVPPHRIGVGAAERRLTLDEAVELVEHLWLGQLDC